MSESSLSIISNKDLSDFYHKCSGICNCIACSKQIALLNIVSSPYYTVDKNVCPIGTCMLKYKLPHSYRDSCLLQMLRVTK